MLYSIFAPGMDRASIKGNFWKKLGFNEHGSDVILRTVLVSLMFFDANFIFPWTAHLLECNNGMRLE
jgi:hypothetical protein